MEPETLLKIIAIILGLAILVVNFVDLNWLIDKLLTDKKDDHPETIVIEEKNDKLFLNIVDLWYKLKDSCESYGLKNAADKLDEVFPLLNDKKDGDEV
jgi:hypothetical protein